MRNKFQTIDFKQEVYDEDRQEENLEKSFDEEISATETQNNQDEE